MSRLWPYLEELHGLSAVPAAWRRGLGEDYEAAKNAFLTNTRKPAASFPSPYLCGCTLRVVPNVEGEFTGVSDCGSVGCRDVSLSVAEVMLWELNWKKLGLATVKAFDCDAREADLGVGGTRQIGAFSGGSVPVVLTIQNGQEGLRDAVGQLVARWQRPFVLLGPTARFVDGLSQGLLASVKAGFFDLESNLTLMPSGLLVAAKPGVELFAGLLPKPEEEIGEDELRRIYARILLTAKEPSGVREAPLKEVFDFYCLKGFSAQEVAVKLGCSKGTVMNRLGTLREVTGVPAEKLRAYQPFFEQTENALRDPRARRVRRKGAIFGDDPPDVAE